MMQEDTANQSEYVKNTEYKMYSLNIDNKRLRQENEE